jgi:RNA polymerase sigma-70 factor (sigma-E family)
VNKPEEACVDSAAEERFESWAAAHVARLHRTAYLLCGDWHVAEDLVQETLTRAALHWKRVEAADSPDAYVWKILANQAKQRGRRRSNREPVVAPSHWAGIPDGTEDRAVRDELMLAVKQLPHRQRAAVVFRYFEQLSEAETAEALGCSVGNVKSQTHRALKTLRQLMSSEVSPC